jgi:hypothetical protein
VNHDLFRSFLIIIFRLTFNNQLTAMRFTNRLFLKKYKKTFPEFRFVSPFPSLKALSSFLKSY